MTACCIHRLPPLDNAGEDVFEPTRVGYQVTWVQWDPRSFPAVDPPASVVLTDTDSIRDLAHSPCGAQSGDGSEEGSKCFEAGVATSLRLDGLDESLGLAFAVRAVTTGGMGRYAILDHVNSIAMLSDDAICRTLEFKIGYADGMEYGLGKRFWPELDKEDMRWKGMGTK